MACPWQEDVGTILTRRYFQVCKVGPIVEVGSSGHVAYSRHCAEEVCPVYGIVQV